MSVELRTDMLHPGQQGGFLALMAEEGSAIGRTILGRLLGFYTCDMDKRILMPAPFEAAQSLDWQGPWRPEIPT
jgi:hypothetical protein